MFTLYRSTLPRNQKVSCNSCPQSTTFWKNVDMRMASFPCNSGTAHMEKGVLSAARHLEDDEGKEKANGGEED